MAVPKIQSEMNIIHTLAAKIVVTGILKCTIGYVEVCHNPVLVCSRICKPNDCFDVCSDEFSFSEL